MISGKYYLPTAYKPFILLSFFKSYDSTPTTQEDRRLLSAVFCYICNHAYLLDF